eukprot:124670_1
MPRESGYTVPRNFKLLAEYDCAIGKGARDSLVATAHAQWIQYGLKDSDNDIYLERWMGTIIGPQGKQIGQNIYQVSIDVPLNYPDVPPSVKFNAPQIAMAAVDARGNVNLSALQPSFYWNPNMDIANVLVAIRKNMENTEVCIASAPLSGLSY